MTRKFAAAFALLLMLPWTGAAAAQAPVPSPAAAAPAAPAQPVGIDVRDNGLFARLYVPEGLNGRAPAIIALGGSEGGIRGADGLARRLVREGYVVLALAYFAEPGLPEALTEVPLETFDNGLDYLRARPEVDPARIGVIGASKGGEAALILASRRPEIRAVVAGVATHVVWQGIDLRDYTVVKSSWSVAGKPVPFIPYDQTGGFTGIRDLYDRSIPRAGEEGEAAIPVERIAGDVLLVSAGKDGLWPSTPMSDRVVSRLRAAKFRRRVEHLAYPDAGHAVLGAPVTAEQAKALARFGGTPEANMAARADAWPKVLAFLAAALKQK